MLYCTDGHAIAAAAAPVTRQQWYYCRIKRQPKHLSPLLLNPYPPPPTQPRTKSWQQQWQWRARASMGPRLRGCGGRGWRLRYGCAGIWLVSDSAGSTGVGSLSSSVSTSTASSSSSSCLRRILPLPAATKLTLAVMELLCLRRSGGVPATAWTR